MTTVHGEFGLCDENRERHTRYVFTSRHAISSRLGTCTIIIRYRKATDRDRHWYSYMYLLSVVVVVVASPGKSQLDRMGHVSCSKFISHQANRRHVNGMVGNCFAINNDWPFVPLWSNKLHVRMKYSYVHINMGIGWNWITSVNHGIGKEIYRSMDCTIPRWFFIRNSFNVTVPETPSYVQCNN